MSGSVGFLYINESQDSYTESGGTFVPANDISIGQGRVSATATIPIEAEGSGYVTATLAVAGGDAHVLAGDTVVALGRRILPKAE